ncbi:hypothetical protein LSAT2_016677 [Lamellibrachia satsuma]|nr:hypothetical protein LSAT2_016677 [Lamellibrachia satsuma]
MGQPARHTIWRTACSTYHLANSLLAIPSGEQPARHTIWRTACSTYHLANSVLDIPSGEQPACHTIRRTVCSPYHLANSRSHRKNSVPKEGSWRLPKRRSQDSRANHATMSSFDSTDHWPVIVNSSMRGSELAKILQYQHKVRFSDTTLEHSCIFPLSGVAFLVLPLADIAVNWLPGHPVTIDTHIINTIQKFLSVHRDCYIVGVSASHGEGEIAVFSAIQSKFIGSKLQLLPAHNAQESVEAMLTVAKVKCKSVEGVLRGRLEVLQRSHTPHGVLLHALSTTGLTSHECHVLEQGLGSLSCIASSDRGHLLDCSLDSQAANKIQTFFEKNK